MENKLMNKKGKILSGIFLSIMILTSILLISNVSAYASPAAVNLGTAGNFVILSKAGISTTGVTSITGDIGVSPIDHTAITGFSLIGDETTDAFLTSALVTGNIYASNLVPPTPINLGVSIGDMQTAYTAATSPAPDATELGAGDISGMTLAPGVYKWSTGLLIDNTGVTLSGGATDVFIFQIAQDLTVNNGAIITLSGVLPQNVFWQVAGQATLGTTSDFKGNILSQTAIILNTGATVSGRLLAQTAVTLDSNAVTIPAGAPSLSLTSIAVATPATKLTYTVGDSLDITGLTITKTYSDASTQITTPLPSQVTGLDSLVPITGQVLTVTYGLQTTTYTVDIVAAPVAPSSGGGGSGGGGHFSSYVREDTVYGVPTVTTPTPTTTTPTEETPTTVPSTTSGLTGAVTGGIKNIAKSVWAWIIVGFIAVAGIVTFIVSSAVKHKK